MAQGACASRPGMTWARSCSVHWDIRLST
ncbi:MAG: hypothetical protein OSJ51_11895 [Parabacteroides distasonis]|nr:hypothetical protein [Parabacteroides distasonis]